MWHLAPEAPQELFLDPALLEEAGARGAPKKNKIESDVYLADDKMGYT
jgi:hypothetical protein